MLLTNTYQLLMSGVLLNFVAEVLGRLEENTVCICVNERPDTMEF